MGENKGDDHLVVVVRHHQLKELLTTGARWDVKLETSGITIGHERTSASRMLVKGGIP